MIRIAVVDDHPLMRAGLKQFLADHVDLSIVGEASNAREALDLVSRGGLDLLVLDLALPGQSGVDALESIKARAPELPVLILSGFPATTYAATLLRKGANGYLSKDCEPDEITRAIRAICAGRTYISSNLSHMLATGLVSLDRLAHEQLSGREFQVFIRLAKGETINCLAGSLSLSAKTVSTYRTRVMDKLSLATNSDLTYYAMTHGLMH
jgi:two-component system invasion response regulator UvrY